MGRRSLFWRMVHLFYLGRGYSRWLRGPALRAQGCLSRYPELEAAATTAVRARERGAPAW
jgi:hypothetical protein